VFAGTRTGEDLAAHFASADLFLFPSLTETYGNVTVEAMASGLAVVAFDTGAARLHIRSGSNGVLTGSGDQGEFVRAAADLAAQPAQAHLYGVRARETALALGWDAVVGRLESILLSVADRAAGTEGVLADHAGRVGYRSSVTSGP
jgi:glycosyltransferase involved in cell wall biosynthesis